MRLITFDQESTNNALALAKSKEYGKAVEQLKALRKREDCGERWAVYLDALLARTTYESGDIPSASQLLGQIKERYPAAEMEDRVKKLVDELSEKLESSVVKVKEEEMSEKMLSELDKVPQDNAKRYELACLFFKTERYEEAIEQCLDILKIDRNWEKGKAKALLVKIFDVLGGSSVLAISGRKKLSAILFS